MDDSELISIQRRSLEAVASEIQQLHDRINLEQLRWQMAFGTVVTELEVLSPGARQRMVNMIENIRAGIPDSPMVEVASKMAKEAIDPEGHPF